MELFDKLYAGAKWDVGVAIDRSNALPLDRNSIFPSYDLAAAYAAMDADAIAAELEKLGIDTKINNNAYAGQVLAVVTATETSIYYIDANKKLQEVGGKIGTDGKSIAADADGKLFVYGFDGAETGTLPQKSPVYVKDGEGNDTEEIDHYEIKWVPISAIVEGDGNTITKLSAADDSINVALDTDSDAEKAYSIKVNVSAEENNAISVKEDGLYVATPTPYDDTAVRELIQANTDKFADYYTKEETENEIGRQIGEINHATSLVVYSVDTDNNTYLEVAGDEAKAAQPNVVYYVKSETAINDIYKEYLLIGGKLTLVGDTSTDLSNYYNKNDIDGKVETLEGSISDAKQAGTDASAALNEYKEEVILALADKADKETTYTKLEVDGKLEGYATISALNGKADNDTVTGINERVIALETDNNTNKTNIQNNATAISTHATEFATFKGSVEAKHENYDKTIVALQEKDTAIETRLSNLEKEDENHNNKISALEQADENFTNELSDVARRVGVVENALNDGDSSISARLTAVETKATDNATAISTNAEDIAKINAAIGNVASEGVEASGIKGDIAALDTRMDAVETVAANAATTAGNAEAKVNTLQEQFDELVAEGGEPNTISTLQVNGTSITPVSKVANIGIEIAGSNSAINTVADATSGKVTATISKVSTDILTQGTEILILDGGNA